MSEPINILELRSVNVKKRKNKPRSPSSALLSPFSGEGSPTEIDYREKGTLIIPSLLEDLEAHARLTGVAVR